MVASLPITCAATISVISGMTGFTLPGMIELPGCSDGSEISPMPQRGPEASQRRSLAILVSDTATVLSAPEASTAASFAARASKRLRAGTKAWPLRFAMRAITASANPSGAFSPVPTAVPPRAELGEARLHRLQALDAVRDLLREAAEVLPEPHRHGVLQVGAADLDHVVELDRLGRQGRLKLAQRGLQILGDRGVGGDVDRRRDDVVRRLAGVHVVVRVHRLLAAHRAAEHFDRAVGDHLVGVHVGRGAGPGLVDVERKVRVELALVDLERRLLDGLGERRVDDAEGGVLDRRLALDQSQRGDETALEAQAGHRKVLPRALGLRAPIDVLRHLDLAEAVLFPHACES
jgi:hypothetical protein